MTRLRRAAATAAAVAALLGGTLGGCSRNPATGGLQPPIFYGAETEAEIGDDTHRSMLREYGGLYQNPKAMDVATRVVARLAPHVKLADDAAFDWRVYLLNSHTPNAFAVPGGRVYVSRGLLPWLNSEAELAAVLGHEMGHVAARHSAAKGTVYAIGKIAHAAAVIAGLDPSLSRDIARWSFNAYSRDLETEADALGLDYLAAAGYDPRAAARSQRVTQRLEAYEELIGARAVLTPSWELTHPTSEERIETLEKLAANKPASDDVGDEAAFFAALDGMGWGETTKIAGYVNGRDFIHPRLGVQFTAPPGYRLSMAAKRVTADNPATGGLILFDVAAFDSEAGEDETESALAVAYLKELWATASPLSGVRRRRIAGYPAAIGETRIPTPYGEAAVVAAAILDQRNSRVMRFVCLWPSDGADEEESFRRMIASVSPITRAALLRQTHAHVVATTALPGETIRTLAAGLSWAPQAEQLLRALNGLDKGEEPRPGERLKSLAAN